MDKPVPVEPVAGGQAGSTQTDATQIDAALVAVTPVDVSPVDVTPVDVTPVALAVEVAYARPEQQTLLALTVPVASTVEQAIRQSGLLTRHPEIDLTVNAVGIWSRPVSLQQLVQAGDRIEIYRPLIIDPRTTLRQREKAKRKR